MIMRYQITHIIYRNHGLISFEVINYQIYRTFHLQVTLTSMFATRKKLETVNTRMNQFNEHIKIYALLFVLAAAIVLPMTKLSSSLVYPYTSDGITYVEAAQNLLAGNGLLVTPFGSEPYAVDLEPLKVFQPGYPVLIAGATMLGLGAADAALWISIFCWAALLPAIFFCLRPLIGFLPASICGLVTVFSAPALFTGPNAFSDMPCLLATCLSLGVLFRSIGDKPWWAGVLFSGLLAGLAYSLRNSAMALLISICVMFFLAAATRLISVRRASTFFVLWCLGVFPILALLWGRNFALFGSIQPYSHPPAGLDLLTVVRQYFGSLLFALSGSRKVAMLAWDSKAFVAITLPAGVAIAFGAWRRWPGMPLQTRLAVFTIGLYVATGSVMLVSAHYLVGAHDYGTGRYAMQYSWLILAAIAIAAGAVEGRRLQRALVVGGLLATLGLVASHGTFIYEFSQKPPSVRKMLLNDEQLLSKVKTIPGDGLIMTNLVGFLSLETNRHVRNLETSGMPDINKYMNNLANTLGRAARSTTRPVYGVILPLENFLQPTYATRWQQVFLDALPKEFVVLDRTQNMILIRTKEH